ncbi:MOSC domain-containing protein [Mycolicibacterium sp. S2-37]|uniref:MOSC domain-containing protein n=1 Tax=Mycolicibacterium sp. S2-37 TaxID=2810297 RepID=UPI001A93EC0C|nr:MOSC N-terminal beta barrel domain-containing protein [Mycolicibacterium sp. S2-37]MBO0678758.1 MOSC domain-containing protein [Mycolicibacterium sp. S2-37]
MTAVGAEQQTHVGSLRRYPVKSMLGETVTEFSVGFGGVEGDRRLALIDRETGRVASAKQARLWRHLLQCSARIEDGRVWIRLPDSTEVAADDDRVEEQLSTLLSRPVRLTDQRPEGASVERADPEQVLRQGLDAEVDAPLLELAEGTPGDSFVDLAPLHVITTATLDHIGIEVERYRPNIVVATPPGYAPYAENEWTGRILTLGSVQLKGMGPTPRCVIPTLEQAGLGRAPQALRTPTAENRVESFGLGRLPCAGAYMEVAVEGTVHIGDQVALP